MGQGQSGTPKSGRRGSAQAQLPPVTITGDFSTTLSGEHKQAVLCCAFSPDEKLLVTGDGDGKAVVWALANGKPVARLAGHTDDVTGCAFVGATSLVTVSRDGSAIVWLRKTWAVGSSYSSHEGAILGCAVSHDQENIATCSADKTVHIWPPVRAHRHGKPTSLRGHTEAVLACRFSPDDVAVGTCSSDNTIRLWNRRSGKMITEIKDPLGPRSLGFSPDGVFVCVASNDNMMRIWNVNSEEVVNSLAGHSQFVTCCDFNCAGNILASTSHDTHARLWDPRDVGGKSIKVLAGHSASVVACKFSPSGRFLATVSADKTCRVWK